MTEMTISIPYTERVWGMLELIVELPEGVKPDDVLKDIQSGNVTPWGMDIVHEAWVTLDSDLEPDINYEETEILP